jgi:hypothetical protein
MKYVQYFLLLSAIVITFVSLYYWLVRWQIDYAALCMAMAVGLHSVYLHAAKVNRPG